MEQQFVERRAPVHQRLASWVDRRHFFSVRAAVLAATVWMTWDVTQWAKAFAYAEGIEPLGKAAIIAAATACVSALQGFVFAAYMKAKDRP